MLFQSIADLNAGIKAIYCVWYVEIITWIVWDSKGYQPLQNIKQLQQLPDIQNSEPF